MEISPDSATALSPPPPIESLPLAIVDALLNFSEAATRAARPDDLLAAIVATAVGLVAAEWGILLLRDPESDQMRVAQVQGIRPTMLPPVIPLNHAGPVYHRLSQGAALLIEDMRAPLDATPALRPFAGLTAGSLLIAPLQTADTVLGALLVACPTPHGFDPTAVAALERLGRLAAQVLRHSRTLTASEVRAGALEAMQAVATQTEATLDLDRLLDLLVHQATALTGASGCIIMLWDADEGALIMRKDLNAAPVPRRVLVNEGLSGRAFSTGQPQVHNSYHNFDGAVEVVAQGGVTNGLAVPLLRRGEPFGIMTVFSYVFKPFTAQDMDLLTLFAGQVAVALDNQQLYTTVLRQQQQLDNIIDALHDALVVYDRNLQVTLINPAAREMLGLSPAAVGRTRDEMLAHPQQYALYRLERLHDWQSTVQAVLGKGVTLAGMTQVHSEPPRLVQTFYSPWRDEGGEIIGVIALARDVSESQELERLRGELDLARQRDDFLSIAAHELRTPVTAIKGFSDLLLRRLRPGQPLVERDQAMLRQMRGQVDRLAALVNDLLDVGRMGANQVQFHWGVASVNGVVRAAIDSVRPVAGPRETDIHFDSGDDAPVRCDPARLEQVFVNLLTNALKYAPSGAILIRTAQAGDRVRVSVRDEGAGIATEDMPRLFERFFRAHDVYAHQRGLGLGLYICREIVQRHDGEIRVESTPGAGSTFTVELPVAGTEEKANDAS